MKRGIEEIKKLKDQIEHCLKEYPATRNSDVKLTWFVWRIFYDVEYRVNEKMMTHRLPTQDAAKRIRAKFNERWMYLPNNDKVLKDRWLLQKAHARFFNNN